MNTHSEIRRLEQSEIKNIKNKIRYYKTIELTGKELNLKQQQKLDSLIEQLNQLEPQQTEDEKLEHKKMMIERNKQRSRDRYQRLKDDPGFQEKNRINRRNWYHRNKQSEK